MWPQFYGSFDSLNGRIPLRCMIVLLNSLSPSFRFSDFGSADNQGDLLACKLEWSSNSSEVLLQPPKGGLGVRL